MSIIGKHIITHWKHNNGFEDRWVRFINRETSVHYISDVQWTTHNYDTGEQRCFKKCATKFVKEGDDGFRVSKSTRSMMDSGVFTANIVEDFTTLRCKHSFDEIFNTDMRNVYPEKSKALDYIVFLADLYGKHGISEEKICSVGFRSRHTDETDHFKILNDHLREMFNVKDIYRVNEYHEERGSDMSYVQREVIYMQVNHFGGYKDSRTREENAWNTTIGFWLFEDKLAYFTCDGKSSW